MLTFHSFRASGSTYSRFHHRLPKSFNADAISSLHFFEIDTRRKPVFWTLRNYVTNSRIWNDFQISRRSSCWLLIALNIWAEVSIEQLLCPVDLHWVLQLPSAVSLLTAPVYSVSVPGQGKTWPICLYCYSQHSSPACIGVFHEKPYQRLSNIQ